MLRPEPNTDIPELSPQIARATFPNGNRDTTLRDELGTVFDDERFADFYATLGQPTTSPGRLALVTVMQTMEDLTDREAERMRYAVALTGGRLSRRQAQLNSPYAESGTICPIGLWTTRIELGGDRASSSTLKSEYRAAASGMTADFRC